MEKIEPQSTIKLHSYTSSHSYPQPQQPSMPPQTIYTVVSSIAFSKESQHMTCPHCHAKISTRVESEANTKTHMMALFLCVSGCCLCAPCVYCMDSCIVQKHYCPACDSFLGESKN